MVDKANTSNEESSAKEGGNVEGMVSSAIFLTATNGAHLDQLAEVEACLNCNTSSQSAFCPGCGQKKITKRLSFGRLLKEIPQTFFKLDRGFLRTLWEMFRRPGSMARDYVYGKRKRYVNPFAYFLIGATVQLMSLWFSGPYIRESFKLSIENGALPNRDKLDEVFDGNVAEGMADVYLAAIAQSYTYAAFLFFALPLAFGLWLLHRSIGGKRRSQYRFAEVLVFALYVVGHLLIMTGFVMPIALSQFPALGGYVGPSIYLGFMLYAHHGFFRNGILAHGITIVSMLGAMVVFFASIVGIFIGSLVVAAVFKSMTGA